ncbi:MAG: twin-arginine translocase subunit TatC, partial [Prolixibacteraceae bacterium]|nr:twin-arginine translocase subunit TatC [Prolixibacteraceae bacterium]
INTTPLNIVNIEMAGQFMSHIKVSLIAGLIVASPYVIWEVWRFIKPALHSNEAKHATGAVFYSSVLFILGILFGYYIITPLSVHFLSSYNVSQEIANTIKLNSYIATVTSVTFASGIIFELPIVVLFLSKIGLLSPTFMRKYRKHAYVLLLIISAIITPPDIFSQVLVCVPLIVLYEISVFVSRSVHRKRERMAKEEEGQVGKPANKAIKDEVPFDRSYIDGSEEKP